MSTNDSTPDPAAGDTNTCLPECSDWSGHVCPGSHPVASTPAGEGLTEAERETDERERIAQAIEEVARKHPNHPCDCRGCSAFRYAARLARGDA